MAINNDDLRTVGLFKEYTSKMGEIFYSYDKPNQNLREFVERHVKNRPHNLDKDDYDVPAFDKPIDTTKATAIYNMHTFWSKKPHGAIRQYIEHYTRPGDLVLDVFAGSGGTGTACRQLSRDAILGDLSPFCSFLAINYSYPICFEESQSAIIKILRELESEYGWMYFIGKKKIESFLHSDRIRCIKCMKDIYVADCEALGKSTYVCANCGEQWNSRSSSVEWLDAQVWGVFRKSGRSLKLDRLKDDERVMLQAIEPKILRELEQINLPDTPVPKALMDLGGRLATTKTTIMKKLYSVRVQLLLARILEKINQESSQELQIALKFIVSAVLLNLTLMYQYRTGGGGKPGGGGAYYVPPIRRELNFFSAIQDKLKDITKGRIEQINSFDKNSQVIVSTEDALELLQRLQSNSIDYVFTDPPYADTMPYAALNCVWDYWLFGARVDYSDEILGANWRSRMEEITPELFRVLKPGRCISVCYHDTSEGTWADLQDVMALAGFLVEQVKGALGIDTSQKAYQQLRGNKVIKRDLVVNFRKPKLGEVVTTIAINGYEDVETFNEKVRQIIRDYLSNHPGSTKDRVYDEVVSSMVRRGLMEAHNFDDLLKQVAEEVKSPQKKDLFENEPPNLWGTHEISRWYLKETELAVSDAAETRKEDEAAEKIGSFIREHLRKNPGDEGVHYSDLFGHYVYSVKDKPRRHLAEFLPDYFYKTDLGTWRLPASVDENKAKAEGRSKGMSRRIKRYLVQLEQGIAIPENEQPSDATLAEWIRHCKRSGLYEHGKVLYEKGGLSLDNLPEDMMVKVEEDYHVCARLLARSTGDVTNKKKDRKK